MFNQRTLRFLTFGDGCIVPISHSLNKDGYFRKRWKDGIEMFHRFIYRIHFGPIPDGYEVDHICRNRACCNKNHLRLLSKLDHAVHTNSTRYQDRYLSARNHWEKSQCSGTSLAEKFGVTVSTGCRWIRQFKDDL